MTSPVFPDPSPPGAGGYGGGGAGGSGQAGPDGPGAGGAGGGGGSFVYDPSGLVIVAGGGGGSTASSNGGSGNGVAAASQISGTGGCYAHTGCGGQPGGQTGGGAPGSSPNQATAPTAGSGPASLSRPGVGGNGGSTSEAGGSGGGGGGGGYYGGGGGAGDGIADNCCTGSNGGGGGGSGYLSPSLTETSSFAYMNDDGGGGGKVIFKYTPGGLIVNSTQDTTDQTEASAGVCNVTPLAATATCTLPEAILVSNDTAGQTIDFDIPQGSGNTFDDGVPQIKVTSVLLPSITAPTVIDGTSQPGVGRVELSGAVSDPSVVPGLIVAAGGAGSTIKGMVINGYQEMIVLLGGGDTVEGNWLGTNVDGTAADPTPLGPNSNAFLPIAQVAVRVQSSGNQIGAPGAGNVVGSGYTAGDQGVGVFGPPVTTYGLESAGEIDDTAGGNVIQGNRIGLAPGSNAPLILPPSSVYTPLEVEFALSLSGAADTVGGSGSGDGNVIAGGGSISSNGSVLQGNAITDGGLEEPAAGKGAIDVGNLRVDGAVTVGGPTLTPGEGDGNQFYPVDPELPELLIMGSGAVVEGNVFRGDPYGGVDDSGTDVTIGGASEYGVGNLFEDDGHSADPEDFERSTPAEVAQLLGAGIIGPAEQSRIEHNEFEGNIGGGAVSLGGLGETVTDNVMRGNVQGITFLGLYDYDGDRDPDIPGGPNGYQYYPLLFGAYRRDGGIRITGHLTGLPRLGGTYQIELYSQPSCESDSVTPGQGEHYLGAQHLYAVAQLVRHPLGVLFTLNFPAAAAGDDAVTATATAPDGSTSEFSPCLTLDHKTPIFKINGVTPTAKTVPVTTSSAAPAADRATVTATAAKAKQPSSAHGTLNLFCPPATSGYCKGTFALKTSGKRGS